MYHRAAFSSPCENGRRLKNGRWTAHVSSTGTYRDKYNIYYIIIIYIIIDSIKYFFSKKPADLIYSAYEDYFKQQNDRNKLMDKLLGESREDQGFTKSDCLGLIQIS